MFRTALLFVFLSLLITASGADGRGAESAPASFPGPVPDRPAGSAQSFAPGQVLVRFKSNATAQSLASVAGLVGSGELRRVAGNTFALAVPPGQEAQTVRALLSAPAVESAALNYRISEPPIELLQPEQVYPSPLAESLTQEPESCITDLWMSTTQQGERLQENLVPSETAQVYVFFEYTECQLEAVRIQLFFLGRDTAPAEVFDSEGTIISGSGVQGVKVQAWPIFVKGTFPVGKYLTIVSLSPEGGWDVVKSAAWRVSTFSNDHWFRGISNYQWPLHSTGRRALPEADINIPQAWDITTGSPDLTIAVISTGAVTTHPDLKNKTWLNRGETPGNGIDDDENGCVDDTNGAEFYNGECFPNPTDPVGWGTFSSGIAAAETNNEIGMAGVSWGARVMSIKVLRVQPNGRLGGYLADLIRAIEYAVANGARIIHIGPRVEDENVPPELLEILRSTIDDAVSQGALVIAGTGDEDAARLRLPAGFDNVVAVGATGLRNERAYFSNYGQGIDLVAPGEGILSTCGSAQYCIGSGTSLAAAHVDGAAALIWSVNPDLSPAEVRTILRETAYDLGSDGYDEDYGYGKLDAAAAVERTPHHLWLRTANLDRLALVFLVDEQVGRSCQAVWNLGTAPSTWKLNSTSEWLTVGEPADPPPAPVPSDMQVCIDAAQLSGAGTFETTVQASSSLARHNGPVSIDVTAVYLPQLRRIWLSLAQGP